MNLQMPIRLIATDMDGTLLTDEPLILPETADVLRRAAEKGIVLSLASGRLPDDASFFAVDAKLPMHVIALNGAVTLVKPLGDVQEAHHLPQPTVHRSRRGWTKQTCSTRCSACTRWLRRTTCRFPARRWSSAHS